MLKSFSSKEFTRRILILVVLILVASALMTAPTLAMDPNDNEKASKSCLSKPYIEKINENLYVEKKEEDLFFSMQRIHNNNIKPWFKLIKKELKLIKKWSQKPTTSEIRSNLYDGLIGF